MSINVNEDAHIHDGAGTPITSVTDPDDETIQRIHVDAQLDDGVAATLRDINSTLNNMQESMEIMVTLMTEILSE